MSRSSGGPPPTGNGLRPVYDCETCGTQYSGGHHVCHTKEGQLAMTTHPAANPSPEPDADVDADATTSGYRLVHDPADPRCMIENAMGWEHGSRHDGEFEVTPEQEEARDRASDLYDDICHNHDQGRPARNDAERRIYAELDSEASEQEADRALADLEAEQEETWAYNHGGLQAVSPSWLETERGRDFLAGIHEAEQAEFADLEAGQ